MDNDTMNNFELAVRSFTRRVTRALDLSEQEENYVSYEAWRVINKVLDRKKKIIQNRFRIHKIDIDKEV